MTNFTIAKNDYSLQDGIAVLTAIFKKGYLAQEGGFYQHYFSMVTTGYKFGNFANFPPRIVDSINEVAERAAIRLSHTRITDEDVVGQIKALGKWVNLPNLFQTEMGWTYGKMNGRLRLKTATCYGKFSAEELRDINETINRMALKAMQVHIVLPVQDNIDNKVETATDVQDSSKE